MAFFGLFRYFGPFGTFLAGFGIPDEGCFTSTPRAGALYPVFRGFLDLGPGEPGKAQNGPKTRENPKMGFRALRSPGGGSLGSGPGTGPRREGLM